MTAPDDDAAQLLSTLTGAWVAHAVSAAARLGLPDALAGSRASGAELAGRLGADPAGLAALLRLLVAAGIVTGDDAAGFALTGRGALLRRDVPGSLHALAVLYGERYFTEAWAALDGALRGGRTAFETAHGEPVYAFLASHPAEAERFDAGMAAGSALAAGLPSVCDLSGARLVVDVGGGDGTLLAAVLRENPAARGVLLDRPPVADAARDRLAGLGLAERCETVGGDFFAGVPAGADAYLLCRVLHNWDDGACGRILAGIRRGMGPSSRLLLVERVVPAADVPLLTAAFDVHMLVMTGGRERTEEEYRALLAAAGLHAGPAVPLVAGLAVLPARVA